MFRNYFKIAWRNLQKNKIFSFINVFGLAIGLTCCILITLYISHETSYDSHHKNINQLYQLGTMFLKDGKGDKMPNTPAPMAAAMKQEFPEISEAARILALFADDKTLMQYRPASGDPKSFYETKGYLADSTFFRLFSYDFIEGNPSSCLDAPNTIVLSEEIAKRIFGNEPALNKTIWLSSNTNGDTSFTVTGVFRTSKKLTQIDARFFLSVRGGNMETFISRQTDMVSNNMFFTFFLLKPGADANKLQSKFSAFVDKYLAQGLKSAGFFKKQLLIPVKDMHLYSGMKANISAVGSIKSLYVLSSIALFTLILACINFMNLSTARSSKRSTEVGIRKVLGAEKNSLVKQFIGESVLMSVIALIVAFGLTSLSLQGFSYISGAELSFDFASHWPLFLGFFAVAIVTGIIAGSYPAFYLSSFRPVRVLKGRFTNSLSAVALRKGLVVFQFIISVALIIAAVVISKQMKYMSTKDLGFARDQQIVIPMRSNNAKNIYTALKDGIRKNDQVLQVGASMVYPGIMNPSDMNVRREGKTSDDSRNVRTNVIDESFLQTLDVKPVAGRLFSEQFPGDTANAFVINMEAVKQLGYSSPDQAVGSKLYLDYRGQTYDFDVVGVVKDFHFQDLRSPILPYGFFLNSRPYYNYLIVHTKAKTVSSLLKSIGDSWHRLNPNEPFEYSFLDDDFQKNYQSESKLLAMVDSFTIIAILICCLGLFGLAAFSAEQRVKEIGIRKVLGASIASIIGLLSKEFLKLVFVALVVASPIAWWLMNKWLQDFAYRTSISWWVFALTAMSALLIALITVSFQAMKAALTNPVENLRTE